MTTPRQDALILQAVSLAVIAGGSSLVYFLVYQVWQQAHMLSLAPSCVNMLVFAQIGILFSVLLACGLTAIGVYMLCLYNKVFRSLPKPRRIKKRLFLA